jgi:hypothetical protein
MIMTLDLKIWADSGNTSKADLAHLRNFYI